MEENRSELVAEVILEDKLVDIWSEFPCIYNVRSPDFKNRDLREKAFEEIAEKLGQSSSLYTN
jgi:hypothetical protein